MSAGVFGSVRVRIGRKSVEIKASVSPLERMHNTEQGLADLMHDRLQQAHWMAVARLGPQGRRP